MSIGLSDSLSLAALTVSVLSMLYAKKQSDFAKKTFINDYRSHLSEHHSMYQKALIEVKKKHKGEIKKLSQLAGKTLITIVHHFDEFDINPDTDRRLRHLIHESSEMVFYTFKGQLVWQTAQNISHRLYQISNIEDMLNPQINKFGGSSFRTVTKEKYISNPNLHMEQDLKNDIYFCNMLLEMISRIDQSKLDILMTTIQKELNTFSSLHKQLQPFFYKSARHIEELIEEGNKEHFQLKESQQLYNEMQRRMTILGTLSYICPPEIDKSYSGKHFNYISKSIHACAILHAIQGVHSWGWEYEW
ncbi:hypothetical protein J2125_001068 [Erwinia toletana]|uniref:Uncharacterized protein n=1 Tax=Winslowiella toletana TaxID=92490 RepID=A0ABS4P727_9GAMM|nr:hypothetical protein [Winslowiella toletana]MBP2167876.1 hypothetical protein [Winslowiella toletana]